MGRGCGVRGRAGAMAGAWSSSTRDPPARDTYLLKVDQRCVVSSRDRACQMRDGGIAECPGHTVARRVYQLLRPKSPRPKETWTLES